MAFLDQNIFSIELHRVPLNREIYTPPSLSFFFFFFTHASFKNLYLITIVFYLIANRDTYNFSNFTVRVSVKVTLFLADFHREEAISFSF